MKMRYSIPCSFFVLMASCQMDKANLDPSGYWADSSGMALFQVKQDSGDNYSISSSLGALKGKRVENSVRGTTDLNDSFSMVVNGDSAVYSVLGVSIGYKRITLQKYDSLTRLLSP